MIPRGSAKQPLTVGNLTQIIKSLLEAGLFNVWVEGELTQVNAHRSGHVYLTLKDRDARLEAVMWRTTAQRQRYRPGQGARVIAFGRISVYAPQGKYQLVVERLLPAGQGDQQAALEALTKALQAEGLFEEARKRPLPRLPKAVGVVTSGSGAARRDIESVIQRRAPQIPIVLYPAQVQGEGAAHDVAAGLRALGQRPDVEVIIVGRGGGSAEDLWAFNTEPVARAIAESPVPVISAVGHETDWTLADRVADLRAPTPSVAAEAAVPVRDDLYALLGALGDRLVLAIERRLGHGRADLDGLTRDLRGALAFDRRRVAVLALHHRLEQAVQQRLSTGRARLRAHEARLTTAHPAARTARARAHLTGLIQRLAESGPAQVRQARARHAALRARLTPAARARLVPAQGRLSRAAARLHALSPLAVLGRGYSITRHEGRVLREAATVAPGTRIEVILHRGRLLADVIGTKEEP